MLFQNTGSFIEILYLDLLKLEQLDMEKFWDTYK